LRERQTGIEVLKEEKRGLESKVKVLGGVEGKDR